jgi:hypothetical protein
VITHNPIKPLPLAPGEQIPGLKFLLLNNSYRSCKRESNGFQLRLGVHQNGATLAMWPLMFPWRSLERGSGLELGTRTANWSPRIHRRRPRSSCSGLCFEEERTFSLFGSRAREPERAVIRPLVPTNGSGVSARSPELGVPIVRTGALFQSRMRSFVGIF